MSGSILLSLCLLALPGETPEKKPDGGDGEKVGLRTHVLETEGLNWRKDLFGPLRPYQTFNGPNHVEFPAMPGTLRPQKDSAHGRNAWVVDPAALRKLIAASARIEVGSSQPGISPPPPGRTKNYVADIERVADGPPGRATALAFKPRIDQLREGVTFAVLEAVRSQDGVTVDVTLDDARLITLHTSQYSEGLYKGRPSERVAVQFQIPEVIREHAEGRWSIPKGCALAIPLGVHSVPGEGWSGPVLKERVVLIDAGDVPDEVFATIPQGGMRQAGSFVRGLALGSLVVVLGVGFVGFVSVRKLLRRARAE